MRTSARILTERPARSERAAGQAARVENQDLTPAQRFSSKKERMRWFTAWRVAGSRGPCFMPAKGAKTYSLRALLSASAKAIDCCMWTLSSAVPWRRRSFGPSLRGVGQRGGGLVPFGVLLRELHVPLGVDRVVVLPVGHRRAGDGGPEELRGARRGGERHVAAVRPAADPEAGRVDERELLQLRDPLELVLQLDLAEPLRGWPTRRRGRARRSRGCPSAQTRKPFEARTWSKSEVAPQRSGHDLRVRPAVDVDDDRVLLRGVEVRRLHEPRVEERPVRAGERAHLGRREGVVAEGRLRDEDAPDERPVSAVEDDAGRRVDVRPGVEDETAAGGGDRLVRPLVGGEAGEARAVEGHAVEVPLPWVLLGRGEEDGAGGGVQLRVALDGPGTARDGARRASRPSGSGRGGESRSARRARGSRSRREGRAAARGS